MIRPYIMMLFLFVFIATKIALASFANSLSPKEFGRPLVEVISVYVSFIVG